MAKVDPKTLRAAAMAEGFTLLTILGIGVFLGFAFVPVLVTAVVAGTLMAGLILAASARADTFSPTDTTDHLRLDADQRTVGRTDDDPEVSDG